MDYKILFIVSTIFLCQAVWSQDRVMDFENSFNRAQDYHYTNRDSAYHYYEKTISLANAQDDLDYLFMGYSYLINSNGHFYDLANYQRNIERVDSVLKNDHRLDNFEWADYYRNYVLFDKGNYYYKIKDYTNSKKYFLELYTKIRRLPQNQIFAEDIEMLSSINSFLGLINYHTGRYEQAEYTYRRDIEMVTKHADSLDGWQSSMISSKKLLSQVYEIQKRPVEANVLLREALEYYSIRAKDPRYKNSYVSTLMLLAKNLCNQGSYQKAIDILYHEEGLDNNPFAKEMSFITGDAYLGQGKTKEALDQYQNGLLANLQYRQDQPHQDVALAYGKMVEFYISQDNYDDGFQNLLLAFNTSGTDIELNTYQENPNPQDVFSKRQLLHLLDLKLQLLQLAFADTDNATFLEASINTSHDILRTFDFLKKEFESKLDKQFLAETAYPIFHRMLGISYTAYKINPTPDLLTLALNIAEKNKDFILLEALRSASASQYGSVPQKIIEKEAQLRTEITQLEKNIFDSNDMLADFHAELFTRKEQYYSFLDSLKNKYPKYHDLKYQVKNLDLETIRSKLIEHDGLLISFTITESQLYTIVLGKTDENFVKTEFSELQKQEVRDFYRLISRPSISESDKDIKELAKRLFDKILKKPVKGFSEQNLTIVPDDVLHYLPFDVLCEDDKYLVQNKSIAYANSIASLMELTGKTSMKNKRFLAFAPSFDSEAVNSDERKFGRLRYNRDEIDAIGNYFQTEAYLGANATMNNFIAEASNANTIHLATHASANDEFPDFSYLAFTKEADSSASNILYIKDLYNANLSAEMIVLSACQTGIGKLQAGQGMMSLSKGFYYAGAKSLVNTLWKINDKSTVKLMELFYEELSLGKSKTEALRTAKLKYLESTDDALLKHPYYWSAFVVSGDAGPIYSTNNRWLIVGLGVFLLVLIGFSQRKELKKVRLQN